MQKKCFNRFRGEILINHIKMLKFNILKNKRIKSISLNFIFHFHYFLIIYYDQILIFQVAFLD